MIEVTAGDIYNDFCARYPKMRERVVDWKPYSDFKVMLSMDNDTTLVYDFGTGMCQVVPNEKWKEV